MGRWMPSMNWRKPITQLSFYATRPEVLKHKSNIKRIEAMSHSALRDHQENRLKQLLYHADRTVPYYHDILRETNVISNDEIQLTNFTDLPLLRKTQLREQNDRLRSAKPRSGSYSNTSGGTTGEPVEFIQDDYYLAWNNANRLYYHWLAGREMGEPWIKLWGDEEETMNKQKDVKSRLADFVLNRHVLNSYRMGEQEMSTHVEQINEIEPHSMEVYVESMNELAKYIEQNDLKVHSPNGILSTAGTLYQPVRKRIERVFDAPVLNKYGSREVGTVACECPQQEGLHLFSHTHYVEVVDDDGDPLPPGEEGELAITGLTNYTMPLIRYRIGDMGILKEGQCSCGRPFPMLETVTGRVTDHFRAINGDLVYPGYLRKVLYHRDWVKKFQIRQTAIDHVVYRIVIANGQEPVSSELKEIETKAKQLLGEEVEVEFTFPNEIDPSGSGKYRYTISEVV